jgi:prepilin-type N-terminal cleavage/methylation domain-containing protein
MKQRSAFTLVELLVTSAIMVVVATYSVAVLATSSTIAQRGITSSGVNSQLQQSLDLIGRTVQLVDTTTPTQTAALAWTTGSDSVQVGSILFVSSFVPDTTGAAGTEKVRYAYCAAKVAGSDPALYRLAQFKINLLAADPVLPVTCSAAAIAGAGAPNYLTDATTSVLRFEATPLTTLAPGTSPVAFRITLTATYNPAVAGDGSTARADARTANAITTQRTFMVQQPGTDKPWSGL